MERLIGGAGSDTLTGSSGDDTFDGGAGGDTFNGLGGVDTVTYAPRSKPVIVDVDGGKDDGNVFDGATPTNVQTDVENLIGGAGGDTLSATLADTVVNVLTGGAGDDRLKTREGTATVDWLYCGAGTDQLDRDPSDLAFECETPTTLP